MVSYVVVMLCCQGGSRINQLPKTNLFDLSQSISAISTKHTKLFILYTQITQLFDHRLNFLVLLLALNCRIRCGLVTVYLILNLNGTILLDKVPDKLLKIRNV